MQTRFDRQERLYQAIRLMRRIDLEAGRIMLSELRGSGLTPARRAVLELLIEGGPATVPDAAERLGLKRQFVQRAVAEMIRLGLVESSANPRHRRSFLCCATQEGHAAFDAVHRRELELLSEHLGDINMTEIIVALRVMNRVAACFETLSAEKSGAAGGADSGPAA